MADLIYYVVMSMDGFIADENGGVSCLTPMTTETYNISVVQMAYKNNR